MMSFRTLSLVKWLSVFEDPLDALRYWRVRKRPRLYSARESFRIRQIGGHRIRCRPGTSDFAVLFDTFWGQYHLPPGSLPPKAVIVDLGANIGTTTADFAYRYPHASIIAVEMDKANWELACENTQFCRSRCHLIHAAVWKCEGEITYAGEQEYALAVMGMRANEEASLRRSPARTVDGIFDQYRLQTVDYLKMDIEGAESVVVSHEAKWIERVCSMKIEVHEPATVDGVREILTSRGFRCNREPRHPKCISAVRTT